MQVIKNILRKKARDIFFHYRHIACISESTVSSCSYGVRWFVITLILHLDKSNSHELVLLNCNYTLKLKRQFLTILTHFQFEARTAVNIKA